MDFVVFILFIIKSFVICFLLFVFYVIIAIAVDDCIQSNRTVNRTIDIDKVIDVVDDIETEEERIINYFKTD